MKLNNMNSIFTPRAPITKAIPAGNPLRPWQRYIAAFMAYFLLLQLCLPTVAIAATMLSNGQFSTVLNSPVYRATGNASGSMYARPNYLQVDTQSGATIASFYSQLSPTKKEVLPDTIRIIGDEFVQQRLIRAQISLLLGRTLINSGLTELDQHKALTTAGVAFGTSTAKAFGTPLSAQDTVANNMIWPEKRNINGKEVIIPVVYLNSATLATQPQGHQINLGLSTLFNNIEVNRGVVVSAAGNENYQAVINSLTDILNAGTINGTGNLKLVAGNTFTNLSGQIKANNNLDIHTERGDVINKTQLIPYQAKDGSGTRLAAIATIDANGTITISSGGGITYEGGSSNAFNGALTFDAKGDIVLAPAVTSSQSITKDGGWTINKSSVELMQSKLTTNQMLTLMAGGSISITASELYSPNGGIQLLAKHGIYVADDQGNFQSNRVDKLGRTTGTGSDFESFAIRTVLSAGKGILLKTDAGDVELKAAKITAGEGTQVKAVNGKVRLLITKENSQHYLDTVKKGMWTIKTVHEEYIKETGIPNAIVGGLAVEALAGVDIEYAGREGATLAEQIAEYDKMPDTKWMADIYYGNTKFKDSNGNLVALNTVVDFSKVDLAYKYVREHNTSLSPAAMAIVAICVAVAMGPGAGLIGQGGVIGGSVGGGVIGAALEAGALTLTTAAVQNLAAGKSLEETLKAITSDDALKNLAISMVTAGALNGLDVGKMELFGTGDTASIVNQGAQAVANSVVTAGISVTISGGNLADYRNAFKQSLATYVINTIGQKLSDKISTSKTLNDVGKYVAHASMGCLTSGLTNKLSDADFKDACLSGAGGAVISQAMTAKADKLKNEIEDWAIENASNPDSAITYAQFGPKLESLRAQGADLAKLIAALAAFAVGGDVNAAANSADMVARSNMAKAVDLASIYLEINGTTNCTGLSFTQCQYAHINEILDVNFAEAGFSKADADKYKQQMNEKGLLSAAAEINALYYGNGKNIDALLKQSNSRDGGSSTSSDGVIEFTTLGVDGFTQQLDQFAAGTKQIVDSMTPAEQKAFSLVIGAVVTGPISAIVSSAQNSAIEYVMPDALADAIGTVTEGITNGIGTGITAFIEHDDDANLLDEYNSVANLAATTDEYRDTVGGFGWIVTSITGLGGKKGTNKSPSAQYMKDPGDGSKPPAGKKFAPKKAPLGDNFKNGHLSKIDRDKNGKYMIKNRMFKGGHNQDEFLTGIKDPKSIDPKIQDPRYKPGDEKGIILSDPNVTDVNGRIVGKHNTAKFPETNEGIIQYDDVSNVKYMKSAEKTTYDPNVINDADYAAAAERVSQKVYDEKLSEYLRDPDNNQAINTVDPVSGIKFKVYFNQSATINEGQPFIGNAHIIP